ncbi:MAG: hypothetical protein Q7R75_00330 [bacterium]|nr:hypothetical protein [bacterium]
MNKGRGFYLKISTIVLSFILLVAYFIFGARSYILGPELFIAKPSNGGTVNDSFLVIKGNVSRAALLWINDQSIVADKNGAFEESLLLSKGYNIIGVTAKDKFGRYVNKKLEIVLK